LTNLKLSFITCTDSPVPLEDQVEQACASGVDAVWLSAKKLSVKELLIKGAQIKEICRFKKVSFLVDERPDVALALDADGIHLGVEDIPIAWARQILGGRKAIVCSVSSLGQAMHCSKEGVTMLAVGPLFKKEADDVHVNNKNGVQIYRDDANSAVDLIRLVKERVKAPVIGIGGINLSNVGEVIKAGAVGVAVSRAICNAPSIKDAAKIMIEKLAALKAL